MYADLHIHTQFSDGTMTPEEVVAKAVQLGIGLISICDHNTMDGYPQLEMACKTHQVQCLPGVEIECSFGERILHVLAYNCDIHNARLQKQLQENTDIMEQMSIDLIEKMSKEYPELSMEEYATFQRNPANGGWKGIDYLQSKGFGASYPDCMRYYRDFEVSPAKSFLDVASLCEIIHQAGGVAVLAHPAIQLEQNEEAFLASLSWLSDHGIDGVECFYPSNAQQMTDLCVSFCKERDLLITAGNDSHGEFAKEIQGVRFELGKLQVDMDRLNLKGLVNMNLHTQNTTNVIKDYYEKDARAEWERLNRHKVEFEVTKRFMDRYIKKGDRVVDIGGGPGRYSLYLAEKGCELTLIDLSSANIALAKEKASEQGLSIQMLVGDAREVDTLVSGPYDHVLLMGPLYHLLDEVERVKTIQASLSLLKPGGILFASFISSYGGILYSMKYEPELILLKEIEFQYKLFQDDLPFSGESFTQAYFIRHKDVLPFMSQFPLEKLHYFGQESILSPNEENLIRQPKEVMDRWINLAVEVCEREDLLSFSEHLMYIGRKNV